jgi:hypothetical protein
MPSSQRSPVVREGVAVTATPPTTPPRRGRRMPGLELRSEADPCGLPHKRSVISRGGRDARPVEVELPAGATDASSTSSKLLSAAAKRQGDKARIVTLLHPHQHAALALCSRAGDDILYIGRGRNRFAGNFDDHVAG